MYSQAFWKERSLLYWSRAYDSLKSGEGYDQLKRTIHIGILNFTLFPEAPEFYAEYAITNVKTHQKYTDKFSLRVIDLTKIGLADPKTEAALAKWARIFKTKTLAELESLVGNEEVFKEMIVTIKSLSEDERIRQQCAMREKGERDRISQYNYGYKAGIAQEKINTDTQKERADMAEARADAAEAKANSAKERANSERERADSEKERADSEKKRADLMESELILLKKEITRLKK